MEKVEEIISQVNESIQSKMVIDTECILAISNKITETYRNSKKVLICGNGGSAADAQHIAGELVGRFKKERAALPCIALTTDTSIITAYANDYSFNDVFARQVCAFGEKDDILIAFSTSGNSANIIEAIEDAKRLGMAVIGFTGKDGGRMKDLCDICFCAPSSNTPRIQECHELAYHIICDLVEKELFD